MCKFLKRKNKDKPTHINNFKGDLRKLSSMREHAIEKIKAHDCLFTVTTNVNGQKHYLTFQVEFTFKETDEF